MQPFCVAKSCQWDTFGEGDANGRIVVVSLRYGCQVFLIFKKFFWPSPMALEGASFHIVHSFV